MDSLISVENIRTLADSEAVSFTVERGESICLFGMNGSGKTLLLKTICEIFKPTSGEINKNISHKNIGVCLQFPEHLVFKISAIDEALQITGDSESAEKLLSSLSIAHDRSPFSLSDGEKRLLFLYGYLENKQLCLFDEPFASIDDDTKSLVGAKISDAINNGRTIIYTANREADTKYATKIITVNRQK